MTVGYAPTVLSASLLDQLGYASNFSLGSINPDMFTHEITDYTVSQLFMTRATEVAIDLIVSNGVTLTMAGGTLPDGTILKLEDQSLTVSADTEATAVRRESWNLVTLDIDFNWVENGEVTASLTLGNATGQPTISGTPVVGLDLTADISAIADTDGTTKADNADAGYAYEYQWIRYDGTDHTEISGATSSTYTLTADDVGNQLKVRLSFKDDAGNEERVASDAYPKATSVTADDTTLSLVSNTGQALSANLNIGRVSGSQRKYTVGFNTGENGNGYSLESVTLPIGEPQTDNLTRAGIVVTLHEASTSEDTEPSDTVVHTFDNPSSITAGDLTFTAASTVVLQPDARYFIVANNSATNNNATYDVAVTDSDDEDDTSLQDWTIADVTRFSSGSTWSDESQSRTIQLDLRGKALIVPSGPAMGQPDIMGVPVVGQELTAGTSGITDGDGLPGTFTYRWMRVNANGNNPQNIMGADSSTYTLDDDEGKRVKVQVSFTDNGGNLESLTSDVYPEHGVVEPSNLLVSNTHNPLYSTTVSIGSSSSGNTTQAFSTGPNTAGYAVSSVGIRVQSVAFSDDETITASIREFDNTKNRNLGTLAATLITPTLLGGRINEFIAPANPVLDPNKKYLLNFVGTGNSGFTDLTINRSDGTDETTTDGWTIEDNYRFNGNLQTGDARPLLMIVKSPDADNNAPTFQIAGVTKDFDETIGAATVATAAPLGFSQPVATDPDGDTITYTLYGTGADRFGLSSTQQLLSKAGERYDHEETAAYFLTYRASDGNGGHAEIPLTITITDVDEPPLKPDAPTVSSASDTSLNVSWSHPDNTGRPPITGYVLEYSEDGGTTWTTVNLGAVTNYTITSLAQNTEHSVRIKAINDEGESPFSDTGSATTGDTVRSVTVKYGSAAYTVTEGNSVDIKVILSRDPQRTVEVPIRITEIDGASSDDYSDLPDKVTFLSGETEQTFTFTANTDATDDSGERVRLNFGTLPNNVSSTSPSQAVVSITNRVPETPVVSLQSATVSTTEGNDIVFTVNISYPIDGYKKLFLGAGPSLVPGGSRTATDGEDYNTPHTADFSIQIGYA